MDRYSLYGRVLPTVIAFFPWAVFLSALLDFHPGVNLMIGIISNSLVGFLLANIGRDAGKRLEERLFQKWGGKPSVQSLIYSSGKTPSELLDRLYSRLTSIEPTLRSVFVNDDMPTALNKAESINSYLINKARDVSKHKILFNENIWYGFRRNLFGLKKIAVIGVFFLWVEIGYYIYGYLTNFEVKWVHMNSITILSSFIYSVFVLFVVKEEWVRLQADNYARALINSADNI